MFSGQNTRHHSQFKANTNEFLKREKNENELYMTIFLEFIENTDSVLFYGKAHSQPKNKNTFLTWKQYANRYFLVVNFQW